jgi:hypothetical protein
VVTDDIVTRLRKKYSGQLPICSEAADEIERLQNWELLARDIVQAVIDEGNVPAFHRKIMRRHRSEWPFLWDRIDKAITACKENPTHNGRQHEADFD